MSALSGQTPTSVLTEPGELREFLMGYLKNVGPDPSEAVCLVFTPWHPDITRLRDVRPEYDYRKRELLLHFTNTDRSLPLVIADDLEPVIVDEEIQAFGMRKVCPGVWALAPSLLVPGLIHCYLVLHGVPEPAPWVGRILVVRA